MWGRGGGKTTNSSTRIKTPHSNRHPECNCNTCCDRHGHAARCGSRDAA